VNIASSETAGAGHTVPTALAAARRGGTVVALGIAGGRDVSMDPDLITVRNLEVHGVFGAHSAAWQHVVGLFSEGLLPTGELITHRLRLGEYRRALELVGQPDTGKVLLVPPMGDG
jgi:threonine dehydrogenase-like Zn-dependent dehydrogenase